MRGEGREYTEGALETTTTPLHYSYALHFGCICATQFATGWLDAGLLRHEHLAEVGEAACKPRPGACDPAAVPERHVLQSLRERNVMMIIAIAQITSCTFKTRKYI